LIKLDDTQAGRDLASLDNAGKISMTYGMFGNDDRFLIEVTGTRVAAKIRSVASAFGSRPTFVSVGAKHRTDHG